MEEEKRLDVKNQEEQNGYKNTTREEYDRMLEIYEEELSYLYELHEKHFYKNEIEFSEYEKQALYTIELYNKMMKLYNSMIAQESNQKVVREKDIQDSNAVEASQENNQEVQRNESEDENAEIKDEQKSDEEKNKTESEDKKEKLNSSTQKSGIEDFKMAYDSTKKQCICSFVFNGKKEIVSLSSDIKNYTNTYKSKKEKLVFSQEIQERIFKGFKNRKIKNFDPNMLIALYYAYEKEGHGVEACRAYLTELSNGKKIESNAYKYTVGYRFKELSEFEDSDGEKLTRRDIKTIEKFAKAHEKIAVVVVEERQSWFSKLISKVFKKNKKDEIVQQDSTERNNQNNSQKSMEQKYRTSASSQVERTNENAEIISERNSTIER